MEVAWCTKAGYGTRLIPDGTITAAHFVQTDGQSKSPCSARSRADTGTEYVEITGAGNFVSIGIPPGDGGGELDPSVFHHKSRYSVLLADVRFAYRHGADQLGNPEGGLVFGNSFGGQYQQYSEYDQFFLSLSVE
jgi:hypothetical protein